MSNKLPQSINLLDPVKPPEDVWSGIYSWVFNVGKYLLVGVQVVVLGVFFSRFIFDRINNDLTDNINAQVETLETPSFKLGEIRYNNLHNLLYDISYLQENQGINSVDIGGVLSTIPSSITMTRFSYSDGHVSLNLKSRDLEAIREYEKQLGSNPQYTEVRVSLLKDGTDAEVEFSVMFKISSDFEEYEDAE